MDSLMSRLEQSALRPLIYELLASLRNDNNSPFIARELSRYIRIYLRFADTPVLFFGLEPVNVKLPHGTFAALQSVGMISLSDESIQNSLSDIVISALIGESELCLQLLYGPQYSQAPPIGSEY